jgi:hypothetical protein
MAGYFDKRFAEGSASAGPEVNRWCGHQLPPDPDPTNGMVRVLAGGRWMSWEEWVVSPEHFSETERDITPDAHHPVAERYRGEMCESSGQLCLF